MKGVSNNTRVLEKAELLKSLGEYSGCIRTIESVPEEERSYRMTLLLGWAYSDLAVLGDEDSGRDEPDQGLLGKAAKILAYVEAIRNGEIDIEVGRSIIYVLRADVMILDLLAVTDLEDRKDTAATLEMIGKIIVSSPRPEHQEDYIKMLNENEASMEYACSRMLGKLLEMAKAA